MRLAGQEKLGYYPTPPETLRLLAQALKPETGGLLRLLDPCAGKGEALAAVAKALEDQGGQVTTYGVELSDVRAQEAVQVLDHVIQATWWDVTTRNKAFSLLWLNPPYDWEYGELEEGKKRQRLEYQFLRATEDKLAPGGVLVYIVPQGILGRPNVARFLAGHFDRIQVRRLPADEYDRFNQVVLLGVRRRKAMRDEAAETALIEVGKGGSIPALDADPLDAYVVPVSGIAERSFFFRKAIITPEEGAAIAARHGVLAANKKWADARRVEDNSVGFRPLMPLRRGHLAMLIASGLMGVQRLNGLVIRGRAVKKEVTVESTKDSETTREQFQTELYVLDTHTGKLEIIADAAKLEAFLEQHAVALAKIVQDRHEPLYERPTPEEWASVADVARNKRLPGRAETGLLDAQKHVALAAARGIRANGHAHIVAEMGFGKTLTALAVVESLNAWPAIVMCPSHLTEKWKREVEEGIPGARGVILESVGDMEKLARTYRPGEKVVAIVSKERAKLGPGWRHAAASRSMVVTYHEVTGYPIHGKALVCPRCGSPVTDSEDIPLLFTQQMGKKRRYCGCGEPLHQFDGFRRWPLARFIRDKHKGFFKLLVADEVHQYKAKGSDQGRAFQHLINATGRVLTLTGTFFGGKSTSIFWLLYRLSGDVRREFDFHDERRWASLFGRLEVRYSKKGGADEDGAFTGTRRYRNRAKEIPGISPQIVRYVLPTAIFAKVADLGYDMPPYAEDVVRIPMTPTQEADYRTVYDDLLAEYKNHRFDGEGPSWLAIWLQTSLSRPNSAFREEVVTRLKAKVGKQEIREEVMRLPALVDPDDPADLLPKEEWLVDECRKDVIEGRKVLVYVRQTASRNIQPRLEQVLTSAGLRARVLPASLSPSRREAWIEKHVDDIDVLIVNPRKVETGLDLVAFSTAVFYEPDYSLYTLWQAMRRVWRLGQTQPVNVIYLVYQDTLEEAALALMGEKLKAAMLLYGDNANSAISENVGDGDFLGELAKRVLAGENLSAGGLSGLLKPDTRTTTKPWGSPTQTTPPVPKAPTWDELVRRLRRTNGNGRKKNGRRRKQAAAPAQLSLF